jgi:tRNA threonylcarbamoyladenosine biosynthesis protein TsaE
MIIYIESEKKLPEAAKKIISLIKKLSEEQQNKPWQVKCLAFYGEMGVGKTTLIKAVCKQLNVTSLVNSPSFALINEYFTSGNGKVYHFDFYRIKSTDEALSLGIDDYFYSGYPCLIEWPEQIKTLLPKETITIQMKEQNDGVRILDISE